jgi:LacI family transcriptional regulator
MKSRAITLRDIAVKAGVSVSTVSLALKDSPRLPEATRIRLQQLAQELGYKRDDLYSILMSRRRTGRTETPTQTLGFICPFPHQREWVHHPWLTRFFDGAKARAELYSCVLDPLWLNDGEVTPKRLEKILQSRGIQGLVMGSFPESHTTFDLNWSRYAAVAQGQSLVNPRLHRVMNNYAKSAKSALSALCELGYRRIGFFLEPEVDVRDRRLWSGSFLSYQTTIDSSNRVPIHWWKNDHRDFYQWIQKEKPDVVIATKPIAKTLLEDEGYRIPDDVGLVTTSWHPTQPEWAGINQQLEVAGATAVDLLINQMLTHHRGVPDHALTVLVDGAWTLGPSVRRIGPPVPWDAEQGLKIHIPPMTAPLPRSAKSGLRLKT